jgi:Putative auto-transporter adhesin, head GIN domain
MKATKAGLPVAALAVLGGCVATNTRMETRDFAFANFDSISAANGIDVVLSQGPFAVRAEAPEGKLDMIEIEQQGSELRLRRQSELVFFGVAGRYVVNVTAPGLTAISASGGADVTSSRLTAERLSLNASGGADIEIESLEAGTLSLEASGGGEIGLSGACQSATISASGGGGVEGESLVCASVDLQATESADGTASGGGDVRFLGTPAKIVENESSGGSVSVESR